MAPKKKKPQLVAQLALPEAPRFTPTAQEWQDPLRYIAEVVRPVVEHTSGICRIVPPPEWVAGVAEEFAIDRSSLKFTARVQRVDQLQRKHTAVASQRFWNEYNAWMAANGIKRKGKGGKVNPVFNGQEVELDRLHAVVTRRGGYTAVTEDRSWREIANVLDLEDKSGNAAFSLRKLYEKLLLPFDDHSHKRAAGAFGLLDAAMDAAETETKAAVPAEDDEAAEILSAMLGLAPPASKKRRKSSAKAGKDAAEAPAAPKEKPTVCAKCSGGHMPDKLVPCDRCSKGWHRFCLAPSVEVPAEGDWICPDCRTEEFEAFAFQDTDDYSLEEFQQVAATFEEQWFGAEAAAKLTDKEREAEFWRIVEDGEDVVEVLYGADLDSKEVGSGFPRGPPLGTSTSRFASDPWNLSVLPRQDGYHSSLLRVLDGNIAGVTVPWVYVGMCFSSFCWHVEDHMLYSVNYNHYGAAKQWYGVPAWAASRFEAVFRAELADQIEAQPDLLFQLLSMLSPRALQKAGVPVYSATQAAGEFVVTFPNAYHAGLCLGVNLGEAVNFAAPDWLRFGAAALARLRHFRQPCVVSQEELLLRVAVQQAGPAVTAALAHVPGKAGDAAAAAGQPAEGAVVASSPLVCYHLGRELERVVEEQWVLRAKLWSEGLRRSRRTELRVGFQEGEQDDSECAICHIYMHLSAVECDCCQGRRVCLHHAHNLCGCHMTQRRLVYRHSLRQLESVRAAVQACVPAAAASEIGAAEEASAARIAAAAAAGAASAAVPAAGSAEPNAAPQPAGKQKQQSKEQAAKAPAAAAKADDQAAAPVPKGSKSAGAAVRGAPAQQGVGVPAAGTAGGEQAPADGSAAQQAQTETKPARMHGDGLVRPYASVDICPWDRAELPDWREALQRACEQWRRDAAAAMEQGREKGEVVEELAEECEQYLWGDMSPEAAELAARLQVAAAYMAHINAALTGKHGLEEVEAIVAEDPKPVTDPPGLPKLVEGLAAAREWLQRAAPYFEEARVVELKALEGIASESNRLMVALPEAKQLRERAAAARKLADTMRSALPARDKGRRRTEQLGLTELRALRGQAAELRVDMPELNSLAMALERVDVWQSRVRVLTEMQAPIGELEEMVEEAEALPAAMPELQGLKAVLEKAGIWKAQMETLLSNRATLKRMRECLTAGTRLAVKLPEVEGLRLEIRKREWEESARRSLGPHRQLTLSALAEHVATAKDVGASSTQLAQGLRAKLEVAEAWEARAAELLELQSAGCAEEDRPVVSEVHELQAEGLDTGIRMDRLTQLTAQLMASMGWMERARALLTKAAGSGQQVTGGASGEDGSEGMDIDEQQGEQEAAGESAAPSAMGSQQATPESESWATAAFRRSGKAEDDSGEQQQRQQQQRQTSRTPSTSLAGLPPLPAMPRQPRGVRVPKPKKSEHGSDASGKPELAVINKLLDEYRSLLVRAEEEAEGLRKLRGMADGWLNQARSVLEQDAVTDDQLGLLGELIASGEELGLAIEQVDILKANVEALLWARKVRAFLAQLPDPPCDQARPHLAEQQQKEQQQQQQQQLKKEEGVEQQASPEVPQQQPVDAEAKQSAEVAATAAQQQLSGAAGEAGERQQAVQPAAEPVVEVLPFDKRPLLSEATALLQEGHVLPCDDNLYNRLQSVVKQAQDFESQATHVLTRGRDITTFAHAIEASELERLLLDTERLGLKLENLPVLQQLLAGYRGWEAELEAFTKDASGAPVDPSFEQLASASHAARAWPITSPLRSLADDTFHKTGAWTERLRRALVKRSSGARVDSCMAYLQDSVDAAVQQFERRLDAEKRVVATGGSPASLRPPVPDVADKQELYCLCQRPFGKDTCVQTMVCCKICSEWYHMRCVGLPHNLARATRNYTCPICAAVEGNTVPLEQATAKLQKTRRPDREQLAALLPELDAMPVQPASGVLLRKLITRFDRWGSATNRAVEVHEISRTLEAAADGAPSVLPLSQVMLHALLKSSMALEIDATEYADKVLRLLRCNKWREAVDADLMAPAKMTLEVGQKTLAASKQLGINLDIDITGTKLKAAIAKATKWAEQVEACIRELKKEAKRGKSPSFDEAVGRADVLAKESEQLGLKVDAQLERLQEACKLYCLCKQPYNEDRPMVGCDFCQDWYHHECVGLKVPGSQGDGDEPPDTFRCPLCCMRVAATFEHYHKMPASSLNALKEAALKLPPPPKPAPPAAAAAPAAASPAAAPARASVPAQPAAPGRPVMPPAGFSPAAWQAARQAAIAANMSAAGMQPGGVPAAGLPPEQVAAALGNMSRIFQAGGFQAVPGMMPGVYSMTPQLMAAFQKQQIEALARAKHAATPSGSAGPQKAQAQQVAAGPGTAPRPQQQQQQQQARSVVQQQQQQKMQPPAQPSALSQGAQQAQQAQQPNGDAQLGSKAPAKESQAGPSDAAAKPVVKRKAVGETQQQVAGAAGASSEHRQQEKKQKVVKQPAAASKALQEPKQEAANKPPMVAARVVAGESPQLPATTAPGVLSEQATAAHEAGTAGSRPTAKPHGRRRTGRHQPLMSEDVKGKQASEYEANGTSEAAVPGANPGKRRQQASSPGTAAAPPPDAAALEPPSSGSAGKPAKRPKGEAKQAQLAGQQQPSVTHRRSGRHSQPPEPGPGPTAAPAAASAPDAAA